MTLFVGRKTRVSDGFGDLAIGATATARTLHSKLALGCTRRRGEGLSPIAQNTFMTAAELGWSLGSEHFGTSG